MGRVAFPRAQQFSALDWRKASHAIRRTKRLVQRLEPKQEVPNVATNINEGLSNEQVGDVPQNDQDLVDVEDTTSFTSERPECQFNEIGELMCSLIESERIRADAEVKIDQQKKLLKELMAEELGCLATMEHLEYRKRKARARGEEDLPDIELLVSASEKKRTMCIVKQGKSLLALRMQEARFEQAAVRQAHGEPILFRAVNGHLRNARVADPEANVASRVYIKALRMATNSWKVQQRQRRLRLQKSPSKAVGAMTVEADGCISLSRDHEASLCEAIFRARMAECYASIEPTLIKHGVLDPPSNQPAAPVALPDAGAENNASQEINRQQTLLALEKAHRRINDLRNWVFDGLPRSYGRMRESYILTYEDDGILDEKNEQSPADAYDREHLEKIANAVDTLNEAEAELRALQETAASQGIADPNEPDMLIGMDDPDDGFATTFNTAAERIHHIETAYARPRILAWLVPVCSNGYKSPSEPSVVIATLPGPSIRSVASEGNGISRRDLIARWSAELVDVREESERLLAESRREDAARIAARAAHLASQG